MHQPHRRRSKARPEISAETVSITRHVKEWLLLLRPDEDLNNALGYCLAVYAPEHACDVFGLVTMCTHLHIELLDRNGERSDFTRNFDARLGQIRKDQLGRRTGLWDTRAPHPTINVTQEDMERGLQYTWANPVKAGLVRRLRDFPGFYIGPEHWEKSLRFRRPDFLSDDFPAYMTLVPPRPPGYEDCSLEKVVEHFEKLLKEAEDEAHAERVLQGKVGYLGARYLLDLDPHSALVAPPNWYMRAARRRAARRNRKGAKAKKLSQNPALVAASTPPSSLPVMPAARPKKRPAQADIAPRVRCSSEVGRAAALQFLRKFERDHERGRLEKKAGNHDVVFPHGTNYLRRICGVTVGLPGPKLPTVWASAA